MKGRACTRVTTLLPARLTPCGLMSIHQYSGRYRCLRQSLLFTFQPCCSGMYFPFCPACASHHPAALCQPLDKGTFSHHRVRVILVSYYTHGNWFCQENFTVKFSLPVCLIVIVLCKFIHFKQSLVQVFSGNAVFPLSDTVKYIPVIFRAMVADISIAFQIDDNFFLSLEIV